MQKHSHRGSLNTCLLVVFLLVMTGELSSCTSVPQDPQELAEYEQTNDPFEPTNRYIFAVNNFFDFLLLRPYSRYI